MDSIASNDNHELAPIMRLPDEILVSILTWVTQDDSPQYCGPRCEIRHIHNIKSTLSLCLVCHRFQRIALAFQYHIVCFSRFDMWKMRLVRANLQRNPSLRQYCRTLSLELGESSDWAEDTEALDILSDIFSWLTCVHRLRVEEAFGWGRSPGPWLLFKIAIQHMKQLRALECPYSIELVCGVDLAKYFDIPTLRSLSLHALNSDVINGVPEEKFGISSITSLSIYMDEPTDALRKMIQWPRALSHFELIYKEPSTRPRLIYLDLPMLGSWLLPHRYSLKSISISELHPRGVGKSFNLADFPTLECLRLNRNQMSPEMVPPQIDAELLLGPSLKEFIWNFATDQFCGAKSDFFGTNEEAWLREFASTAIARRRPLNRIVVEIFMLPGDSQDGIKNLREEFQPQGIDIVYDPGDEEDEEV